MPQAASVADLKGQIKRLIVSRLKLEVDPDSIADGEALFAGGLGLDSIDALELVLGIEQEYGVKIEDQEVAAKVLATVDSLAEFVANEQGKR